ncbi:MAG: GNAT family N-acetyltransferase [Gammaproteobacteria bacterium]
MDIELICLGEVGFADIIALHNNPRVLRHLPLAGGTFDESECKKWVESKVIQWEDNGYGPWGILINGVFAGWGGLQLEMGDADLALVLSPEHWGYGRIVYQKIIKIAFEEMGFESVTALLPPSRVRANGMLRLGFQSDGQVRISESLFYRYRLWAPKRTDQSAMAL